MDFQIHLGGGWHTCATINLADPARASRRGPVNFQYDVDYAVEHLDARDHRALSVHLSVDLATRAMPHWPPILVDLLPQGAARKRLERLTENTLSEWALLERGAVNPVGNLRVAPSEKRSRTDHPGFELGEMTARGDAFVDYAHDVGATVAGATDTQGEAPKFWVVQDANGRWHPDHGDAGGFARRYVLLKFPVPESGPMAVDIQYIRRDLLNIALGNRDNHGRNTAVLKDTDGTIQLAPLYDFGPAFLDARAIARVIRWEGEEPGRTNWSMALENLTTRFEEAEVAFADWNLVVTEMRTFGRRLPELPTLMRDCGVDTSIVEQRRPEIDRLARELAALGSD